MTTQDIDPVDALLVEHNVYFWKQEGKTVHLSDRQLRESFKAAIKALCIRERLDELKHIDQDGTWIDDPDRYKREGRSPSMEVWERVEQLQSNLQQPEGGQL